MGMAAPTMLQHLQALERKGCIAREPGRSRSIRLLQSTQGDGAVRDVPVLGRVAAGVPLYAEQNHLGVVRVDATRFRGERLFALRVRGQSMAGAGILPGDLLIVREQSSAESGDIVVAFVDDEATVKRFRRRGRTVRLEPENPDFDVLETTADAVRIAGKVVGLQRTFEPG
jgi:repressor LexA